MTGLPLALFDNRFADALPVASSTNAGSQYAVQNINDWRPYTWWKAGAHPATVTVDCGSPKSADYLAVYGHDIGTQGATMEVRYSSDNFVADDNLAATISPANDLPFLVTFSSQTAQYWQVRTTGPALESLAIVSVGNKLEFPRRLRSGFDPMGRAPAGKFNRNIKGQPLGSVVEYEEWKERLRFRNLTWSWLRSTWNVAWSQHLRAKPWLFVWDPVDHANELFLVESSRGYKAPIGRGEFADLQLQVSGVALLDSSLQFVPVVTAAALLLESGGYLLLESGGKILL